MMRPGDRYQICVEHALSREIQEHAVAVALKGKSKKQQVRYLRDRLLEAGHSNHDEAGCRFARLLMYSIQDQILLPHTEVQQRKGKAIRQLSAGPDVEEALDNAAAMCGREAGTLLTGLPQSTQGKVSHLVSEDEYETVEARVPTLVETKRFLYKQLVVGWESTTDLKVERELAHHLLAYQPLTDKEWQQLESMLREWMEYSPGSGKLFRLLALVQERGEKEKFNERAIRFFTKAVGRFASLVEIGACAALLSAALRPRHGYPFEKVVALGCEEIDRIAQLGETTASLMRELFIAWGDPAVELIDSTTARLTWHRTGFSSDLKSHEHDFQERLLAQVREWQQKNPTPFTIECVFEVRRSYAASDEEPLLRLAEKV